MEQRPLLPRDQVERAAPLIRVAAHPLRLRILDLLRYGEETVGRIAEKVGCSQAVASQHLATLRQHGIVAARRDGQRVYYRVLRLELLALLDCIHSHCRLGIQPR